MTPALDLLVGACIGLLYGAVCLVAGAGSLRLIDRWLSRSPPLPPTARVAMAFALGHALLGTLWLVLTLAGALTAGVVGAIMAVVTAAAFGPGVSALTGGWRAGRLALAGHGSDRLSRAAVAIVGIASVLLLVRALLPPTISDALQIYMVTPKLAAADGHLEFRPYNHHLVYPILCEMNEAAVLLFGNETSATTFDALAGIALLVATFALAREFGLGFTGAMLAPLILLTSSGLTCLIGTCKVDTTGALHSAAALLFACRARHGRGGDGLLAGVFTGAALATKYTNAVLLPGAALILLAARPPGTPRPTTAGLARRTILAAIGGGVVLFPQMIKNLIMVGNPVAPMMAGWFGTADAYWTALIAQEYEFIARLSGWRLWAWPVTLTFDPQFSMLGAISPLYLGLLPALLWVGTGGRLQKLMAIAGGVMILTWAAIDFTPITPRYIYPAVIALAVTAAWCGERLLERPIVRPVLIACCAALSALMLFGLRDVAYAARYFVGAVDRDQFYLQNPYQGPHFEVARFLGEHHRRGERLFLEGIEYVYFLDPGVLADSQSMAEAQASSAGCAARDAVIRDGGFTWVVARTDGGGNAYITARLRWTTCADPPGYEVAFRAGPMLVLKAASGR